MNGMNWTNRLPPHSRSAVGSAFLQFSIVNYLPAYYSLNFFYNRFAANWKIRMNTKSIAMSVSGLKYVVPE